MPIVVEIISTSNRLKFHILDQLSFGRDMIIPINKYAGLGINTPENTIPVTIEPFAVEDGVPPARLFRRRLTAHSTSASEGTPSYTVKGASNVIL